MNTIALIVLLSLRVIIPVVILLVIGEWVRRREDHYWLH